MTAARTPEEWAAIVCELSRELEFMRNLVGERTREAALRLLTASPDIVELSNQLGHALRELDTARSSRVQWQQRCELVEARLTVANPGSRVSVPEHSRLWWERDEAQRQLAQWRGRATAAEANAAEVNRWCVGWEQRARAAEVRIRDAVGRARTVEQQLAGVGPAMTQALAEARDFQDQLALARVELAEAKQIARAAVKDTDALRKQLLALQADCETLRRSKMCELCGEEFSLRGERYCKACRKFVMAEFEASGILTRVPGSVWRSPAARENEQETLRGPDDGRWDNAVRTLEEVGA